LLRAGVVLGIGMIVAPMLAAFVGIFTASRVPEGLRGATHIPAMADKVSFALGSASLVAILAPPGVLIAVMSGLSLASEERRRARAERERSAG
jgi:hypothetical protein